MSPGIWLCHERTRITNKDSGMGDQCYLIMESLLRHRSASMKWPPSQSLSGVASLYLCAFSCIFRSKSTNVTPSQPTIEVRVV